MPDPLKSADVDVAIVDYGMGNLRSVEFACEAVGVRAARTSDPEVVATARGIILPGVGAFGDAMATLRETGLADAIHSAVQREIPVLAVCLGMQLLVSESVEFGRHEGLGVIPGRVVPLERTSVGGDRLKVPHISWASVSPKNGAWEGSPLEAVAPGTYFYFVHSFHVVPEDPSVITSTSSYGGHTFCASMASGRIFACQFHPERSGPSGLAIYARMFRPDVAQETS